MDKNKHIPQRFTPNNLPLEQKINLFKSQDFFIYDRKFYNTLPFDIFPTKTFQYSTNTEKLCEFNKEVMILGLNKCSDIITDINMNTNLEESFMKLSMNVLYDRQPDLINEDFKNEILDIIEKETEEVVDNSRLKSSFYMRKSTLIAPPSGQIINQGSNNSLPKLTKSLSKQIEDDEENLKKLKFLETKIKSKIQNSFDEVEFLSEQAASLKHPTKPNVFVKKIYNLKPFAPMMGFKLSEVIFPTDPLLEQTNSEMEKDFLLLKYPNEALKQIRELPITTLASDEQLFALYKTNSIDNNIKTIEDKILRKREYEFDREYSYRKANDYENFNHYLLFLSKNSSSAFYCPLDKKYQLKKFVQPLSEDWVSDPESLLSKKRSQKTMVVPENPSKEDIADTNRKLEKYGLNFRMKYDDEHFQSKKTKEYNPTPNIKNPPSNLNQKQRNRYQIQ